VGVEAFGFSFPAKFNRSFAEDETLRNRPCRHDWSHGGGAETVVRPDSRLITAISGGWPSVLSNPKSLLETGDPAITANPRHA
jgi:hypothetical protein